MGSKAGSAVKNSEMRAGSNASKSRTAARLKKGRARIGRKGIPIKALVRPQMQQAEVLGEPGGGGPQMIPKQEGLEGFNPG